MVIKLISELKLVSGLKIFPQTGPWNKQTLPVRFVLFSKH